MGISEFELIKQYFNSNGTAVQREDVTLGIGDDGAILAPRVGEELVVSVDTLVQGVHFPFAAKPYDIGFRSLAVNLSDMAAMAAEPAWFTLALTLPEANSDWLRDFSQGIFDLASEYGIALVGGDTTRGPLTISIQMQGFVPKGQALRRDRAQAGDDLYVTGSLGDAAAGLACVEQGDKTPADSYLLGRFSRPEPRVSLGLALRGIASAAIDISDGLLADVGHIAARSQVGALLQVEKLPLSKALISISSLEQARQLALSGGDDYELCFCAPKKQANIIAQLSQQLGLAITCIGQITNDPGIRLEQQGRPVNARNGAGYRHF